MSPDYQTLVLRLEVDASKWLTLSRLLRRTETYR